MSRGGNFAVGDRVLVTPCPYDTYTGLWWVVEIASGDENVGLAKDLRDEARVYFSPHSQRIQRVPWQP